MLNVSIPNGDREYQLSGYEVEDGNQGESYMEFHQNSGSSLKLAIRRDSFGARLSKVLQHAFQDVYVAQGETDLIDVDTDVFVYELVERSLENPDLGLPYLSVLSNTDETASSYPESGVRSEWLLYIRRSGSRMERMTGRVF